jgi:comEA protein
MKVLPSLQQRLGFTHNEVKVVLFLGATFLAGLGIRWYNAATAHDVTASFDYSSTDSEFTARSHALASLAPSSAATPIPSAAHHKPALTDKSINLNTASAEQLVQLPGIGLSYAARIIAYRTEHGPFRKVDELEKVKGIGKARLEEIRPFATVEVPKEVKGRRSEDSLSARPR